MKCYENVEEIYSEALEECISLFNRYADLKLAQIDMAIEIGRKIHNLTLHAKAPLVMLRRLSRDISHARKRVITHHELQQCHQLYLFMSDSGEDVHGLATRFKNDISAEMLLKMSAKHSGSNNECKDNGHPILLTIVKIMRMLNKVQSLTEREQLSKDLLLQIIEQLNSVQQRTIEIIHYCNDYQQNQQLDLFMRIGTE